MRPAPRREEHGTGSDREATKVRERLTRVQEELRRARANVRVLTEQVEHLQDVADTAETRRLVAETPVADREWRLAERDRDNHRRLLAEARDEIDALEAERDRLLDRLLELEGTT